MKFSLHKRHFVKHVIYFHLFITSIFYDLKDIIMEKAYITCIFKLFPYGESLDFDDNLCTLIINIICLID